MSFILDALKKSESERQRQSGPALFEVKIAPPRSRFAAWGVAIGALLAINFVVVGFVLWRGSASRAANSTAAATSGAMAANRTPSAAAARSVSVPAVPAPAPAGGPPTPASATIAATTGSSAAAATAATGTPAAPGAPAQATPAPLNANAAAAGAGTTGAAAAGANENPDDLPAVEPRGSGSQPVNGVLRATESGLPTYQEAAAEPGANIPGLKLDLHVYSRQPDQRFVFLEADTQMLKLREGDATPQGVRVEHITQDGVILSYRGKEFVLPHQ